MRDVAWIEARCEKITETGCWIWMGATMSGYGCFRDRFNGPTKAAHRAVYESAFGPLNHNALHRCDIRQCCNPHHIYDGTQRQNVLDTIARGNHARMKK